MFSSSIWLGWVEGGMRESVRGGMLFFYCRIVDSFHIVLQAALKFLENTYRMILFEEVVISL